MIHIYFDGSSNGKADSPTGSGWVIVQIRANEPDLLLHEDSFPGRGTNNTAELIGAINGLTWVDERKDRYSQEKVVLVGDSQYVLGLASGAFSASSNLELVKELTRLMASLNATCQWVKGHSKNKYNDMADKLAKDAKKTEK